MSEQEFISILELVEYFPGHLYWKDADGVCRGCNQEILRYFGYKSSDELIGKTDYDLLSAVEADALRAIDLHVMQSGEPCIREEPVILDGEVRTFLSKKIPLRNKQGVVTGVLGTSLDITFQKNIEEKLRFEKMRAEQASQVKSEFIANMSHDLRTPLSGMQALAEDIILQTKDDSVSENASLLLQASHDLLNLIDDILQVSRLDSGQEKVHSVSFMLAPLIQNTLSIMKPKALEKSIKLTLAYDDQLPAQVMGPHLVLQRILVNLLSNALKFTAEKGVVDIIIKLNRIEGSQCYIDFIVDDTGIGIAADKLDIIFEKFSRVAASFQGQYSGAGMGLYMVKHYVEQMGGEIDVVSQEGLGSRFHCTIPLELSSAMLDVQQALPASSMLPAERIETVHVLLIEDNKIVQHSQINKLRDANCDVILAENAAEALACFEQCKFDILIVDLGLPDMDGLTLIKTFRSKHDNPNHLLPMILLTAHATEADLAKSELVGVTELLIKPLMTDRLKKLLRDYC